MGREDDKGTLLVFVMYNNLNVLREIKDGRVSICQLTDQEYSTETKRKTNEMRRRDHAILTRGTRSPPYRTAARRPQMAAATPACDRTLARGAADLRLGFLIALSSLGIM